MGPGWLFAPFRLFDTNTTGICETSLVDWYNSPLSGLIYPHLHFDPWCPNFLLYVHVTVLILTSCRLISLVEKVPFWWTSSVSDHSVLFLLFGGVGAAALLQGFWGTPGDLPSPRNEACRWERGSTRCQTCCNWKLFGATCRTAKRCPLAKVPSFAPFPLQCPGSLPGWFGRSAGRPHSSPEI